jgi:hypothetical protein
VAFVHMASPEEADPWFARAGLADAPRISDPEGQLYQAMGLGRVAAATLASPTLWARGFQCAIADRHGFGVQTAQALRQLPGVFLIHDGRVLRAYRHRTPADRPDYVQLCAPVAGVSAAPA